MLSIVRRGPALSTHMHNENTVFSPPPKHVLSLMHILYHCHSASSSSNALFVPGALGPAVLVPRCLINQL